MIKFYIECGTTLNTKSKTGIQRVVREILRETDNLQEKLSIEVIKVRLSGERIIPIEKELLFKVNKPLKIIFIDLIIFYIRKLANKKVIKSFEISINTKIVITKILNWLVNIKESYETNRIPSICDLKNSSNLEILLLLDSTWNKNIWKEIDKFREIGGHVCAVLYDLIPFTHPETVDDLTRYRHTSWWLEAPAHLNTIMCISETVKKEYLVWQVSHNQKNQINEKNIGYFYLGADFQRNDIIINIIESKSYYLTVGTIEPRKNHEFILSVFEELWKENHDITLVLVGVNGWKTESLVNKIDSHQELNKRLFHIKNATDQILYMLYRDSYGVIIASKAEGFGLPIIEALINNVEVLCSDIPIFREVGGNKVDYFDLENTEKLKTLIINKMSIQRKLKNKEKIKNFEWINWNESAEQLILSVLNMAKN